MAKDKERSLNPAAAQRKAEKQKALKKNKAAVAAQRTERLAHRNPDRLQTQIDELRARQSEHGQLPSREQTILAGLERDVAQIRKAKAAHGGGGGAAAAGKSAEDTNSRQDSGTQQVLGKRSRYHDQRHKSPLSSDTDDDVRDIPMPRDTPPPIPRKIDFRRKAETKDAAAPVTAKDPKPIAPQITYESKPVIRNLRKEAVGFVPNVVKKKLDVVRGGPQQPLLEDDELDRLEKEGYSIPGITIPEKRNELETDHNVNELAQEHTPSHSRQAWVEDGDDDG